MDAPRARKCEGLQLAHTCLAPQHAFQISLDHAPVTTPFSRQTAQRSARRAHVLRLNAVRVHAVTRANRALNATTGFTRSTRAHNPPSSLSRAHLPFSVAMFAGIGLQRAAAPRSKIAKVARTRGAFNHVVNEGRLPTNVNIHKPNSLTCTNYFRSDFSPNQL